MARTVNIALAAHLTDTVIKEIEPIEGVTGIRVQRGVSLRPSGDLVTVDLTNPALLRLMQRLQARGLGATPESSITTSTVLSSISSPSIGLLTREPSDATWEEMESSLLKESNTTANTLLLMFCAGVIAVIGVATDVIHVVVGAMLIAPGFEPLTRIALGLVAHSRAAWRGLADLVRLYLALMVGALATTLALLAMGENPLGSGSGYLAAGSLLSFWTTLSATSAIVSAVASVAGAVLIATNRSILTAGVMIGLSLVPAMSVAVMGVVLGEWAVSGQALMRWLIDLVLVVVMSLLVFAWKRRSVQRRRMML